MTHHDNIDIAETLRVAADYFGSMRWLPSEAEAEFAIELTKEALDALPADLGVQTDGVRHVLADPANYDLYQLAPWLDGLANRLTQADNGVLQGISLERPKVQPRRQRKPSQPGKSRRPALANALKQAAKAGKSVKGAEVYQDRIVLQFGEPEPVEPENPWSLDEFRRKETKQ